MRTRRVLLVGMVLASVVVGLLVGVGPSDPNTGSDPASEQLVAPEETGNHLWPYTSRSRSVDDRTLAINVVVRAEPDALRRALVSRSDGNWTEVERDEAVAADASPWQDARGASRYTYIAPDRNTTGTWVRADYQLSTGAYLGRRVHIRAYPAPSGNWTAIQAHEEYWDWFRLRHSVTGIRPGSAYLERDLRDEPFVAAVAREYHGLDGGGGDGWITAIEFAVPALLVGAVRAGDVVLDDWRRGLVDVALPVALAATLLGVRSLGLAAESVVPGLDPRVFAAGLYPVLAAGPPALVRWLAPGRPAGRTAVLAGGGLGAGVVLDLVGVGVRVLPIRLAIHRLGLCCALGLFALGVARGDRRSAAAGLAAWTVALAVTLGGYV